MSKLPVDVSGSELRKALERAGFVFQRQRGSHMVLRREAPYARVIVPNHRIIRPGALMQILSDACLTVDELYALLK